MKAKLKRFGRRARYWLDGKSRQRSLNEEMEHHLELLAGDLKREGMSPEEAAFAARRKFGNIALSAEDSRAAWIARWFSDGQQDLRYTARNLRRDAGYTTFAILIVGFGILLSGFSAFALILASLGIYSVISYSVSRRTQEIGTRMAVGASGGDIQRSVILQTLSLSGAGLAIGVFTSWVLTRAISEMLFGVSATDPATFIGMTVVLALVAAIAGFVPARRASRIDPISALRTN